MRLLRFFRCISAEVIGISLAHRARARATIIPAVSFEMTDLGKLLLVLGGVIVLVGAALLLAGRFNLPLGRLPGDIVYRGKNTVFYFPLTTCIVISVVLSLLFWIFGRHR